MNDNGLCIKTCDAQTGASVSGITLTGNVVHWSCVLSSFSFFGRTRRICLSGG